MLTNIPVIYGAKLTTDWYFRIVIDFIAADKQGKLFSKVSRYRHPAKSLTNAPRIINCLSLTYRKSLLIIIIQ